MTDPSRFQVNWKSSFFFSPCDNSSSPQDLKCLTLSKMGTVAPKTGSPSFLPRPFSASYREGQQHCDRISSSQIFDPFDTDTSLDTTFKDDYDLDELSALLSRQLIQEMDAELVLNNSNNAHSPNYVQSKSTTAVKTVTSSPWYLDDDEKTNKSRSPCFSDFTAFSLLSPTLTQKKRHQDSSSTSLIFDQNSNGYSSDSTTSSSTVATMATTAATTARQDRLGPYGNDSEFDRALSFYQGDDDGHFCFTTATIAPILNSSTLVRSLSSEGDKFNDTIALTESATPFKGLGENELLEKSLAAFVNDTERSTEALLSTRAISSTTTATTATVQPVSTVGVPKKYQVCRHYLARECYRKRCWFAHDLEVKPCKFWIQGSCLKGDTCEFAHGLDCLEPPPSRGVTTTISSNPPSDHHCREYEKVEHKHHRTPPTMADFTILIAKSNRRSRKSHNKKPLKK